MNRAVGSLVIAVLFPVGLLSGNLLLDPTAWPEHQHEASSAIDDASVPIPESASIQTTTVPEPAVRPLQPTEVISVAVAEPGPEASFADSALFTGEIIEVRPLQENDVAIRTHAYGTLDTYLLIRVSNVIERGIARFDAGAVIAVAVEGGGEWYEHLLGRDVPFRLNVWRGRIRNLSAMAC